MTDTERGELLAWLVKYRGDVERAAYGGLPPRETLSLFEDSLHRKMARFVLDLLGSTERTNK